MSGPGRGSFDFQNRENDDDVHLHERIRFTYDALKQNSSLEYRERFILASIPLIKELTKRFVKRYPRLKQDANDLRGLAALILAQLSARWLSVNKFPDCDISKFVCRVVWNAMRRNLIENKLIRIPKQSAADAVKNPESEIARDIERANDAHLLTEADFTIGPKAESHEKTVIDKNSCLDLFRETLDRLIVHLLYDGASTADIAHVADRTIRTIERRRNKIESKLREMNLAIGA